MDWISRKEIFAFVPKQSDLRPSLEKSHKLNDSVCSSVGGDTELNLLRDELNHIRGLVQDREAYLKSLKAEYAKLCSRPTRARSVSAAAKRRNQDQVGKSVPVAQRPPRKDPVIDRLDREEAELLRSISLLS